MKKRCVVCGAIVDASVAVCPVCKATRFEPVDEVVDNKTTDETKFDTTTGANQKKN